MSDEPKPKKKRRPDCSACGGDSAMNERFDAYFCPHCLIWLEDACGSADCGFCPGRPASPPPLETPPAA